MDEAKLSASVTPSVPRRREARLSVALDVRILGIDAHGRAFHQPEVTIDISLSGARITGLTAPLNVGDVVGLQSSGEKGRFKVSWVIPDPDGTFQVGLHCMEKGKSPWRDKIQELSPSDHLNEERYPCNGSVALKASSFATPIWGALRDISAGGCYVECINVAPTGEIVSGEFNLNGVKINGVAEVSTSQAPIGMGLLWCDLGSDGQEKLKGLLEALSQNQGETESGKVKALFKLEELDNLVRILRERMDSNTGTTVNVQTTVRLNEAEEKLSAALHAVKA